MKNVFLNFSIQLIIILAITLGFHLLILNYIEAPLFENKIVLSYTFNALMAIAIFGALYYFKETYKDKLGFLFIAGSFFKFALFFLLFYKSYKQDDIISSFEFAAFFIPYLICLFFETNSLAKLLNKMN